MIFKGNIGTVHCKKISYNKKFDNGFSFMEDYVNKTYYRGYLVHREDGPAIIWNNGSKSWCLNGKHYLEEEYLNIINLKSKLRALNEI